MCQEIFHIHISFPSFRFFMVDNSATNSQKNTNLLLLCDEFLICELIVEIFLKKIEHFPNNNFTRYFPIKKRSTPN